MAAWLPKKITKAHSSCVPLPRAVFLFDCWPPLPSLLVVLGGSRCVRTFTTMECSDCQRCRWSRPAARECRRIASSVYSSSRSRGLNLVDTFSLANYAQLVLCIRRVPCISHPWESWRVEGQRRSHFRIYFIMHTFVLQCVIIRNNRLALHDSFRLIVSYNVIRRFQVISLDSENLFKL